MTSYGFIRTISAVQQVPLRDGVNAIRRLRKTLLYLLLGRDRYWYLEEQLAMRDALRKTQPKNLVEVGALTETDIHDHLTTLYMLTVQLGLKTIVELGTRSGESTLALLLAAKKTGGRVHSFDTDDCVDAKRRVKENGLDAYWTFAKGDDLKAEWNSTIDHLFIDTSHTYDQTLKELQRYEPHVSQGGIITLHDIISYPEFLQVMPAVEDYLRDKPDLTLYRYFNSYGLAVIFKGSGKV